MLHITVLQLTPLHIDGLVQERRNSSALAMKLCPSWTNLLICVCLKKIQATRGDICRYAHNPPTHSVTYMCICVWRRFKRPEVTWHVFSQSSSSPRYIFEEDSYDKRWYGRDAHNPSAHPVTYVYVCLKKIHETIWYGRFGHNPSAHPLQI